jgi:hypothetical protein
MKQLVEGVEIACITGREPSEHDRLARFGHAGTLTPRA